MSQPVIEVKQLSKRYRLGEFGARSLREEAELLWRRLTKNASATGMNGHFPGARPAADRQEFWAVKDVSFSVLPGEVVGIIGRNGAGKSTLLKILSRITEPTEGEVVMRGRVASLLEVGTGFHPELSGRENIYLNGAILGMRAKEIDRKFDEIVDFAEVEQFIDTPVKRYSSGMYVRLAFAVAAHLEPEILIVDEVLAVGDAEFQKKCLGKMSEVAQGGRTILFVSHNLNAVRRLCSRAVFLKGGVLKLDGSVEAVAQSYMEKQGQALGVDDWIHLSTASRSGNGEVKFTAAKYRGQTLGDGSVAQPLPDGELVISMEMVSQVNRTIASLAVAIYDRSGHRLVNADTRSIGESVQLQAGQNRLSIKIDALHLSAGQYIVGLWAADPGATVFDHLEAAFEMEVQNHPLMTSLNESLSPTTCTFCLSPEV